MYDTLNTTKIIEIPIIPKQYDLENYDRVDRSLFKSEMMDCKRRFVHGLILYYQHENILEVGIASGGGTVNIINVSIAPIR